MRTYRIGVLVQYQKETASQWGLWRYIHYYVNAEDEQSAYKRAAKRHLRTTGETPLSFSEVVRYGTAGVIVDFGENHWNQLIERGHIPKGTPESGIVPLE